MVVLDEVIGGASGTDFVEDTVSSEAEASLLGGIISRVLSTDEDTFFGGIVKDGSKGASGTVVTVHGEAGITDTGSLCVSGAGGRAWSSGDTGSVDSVESGIADTEA